MIILRLLLLFLLGFISGLGIEALLSSNSLVTKQERSAYPEWVAISCGFTGCFIGLVYPLLDQIMNIKMKTDNTKVIR
jgi:hypothetical protein